MKSNQSSDFCFWFIRPHDGRVRKIRFSRRIMFGVLTGIACGLLLAVFVGSDYARLQFSRAGNFLMMQKLTWERDQLKNSHDSMKVALEKAQVEKARMAAYEQGVKAKLKALAAVVDASKSLGLPDSKAIAKAAEPKAEDGVGGAERDCGDSCIAGGLSDDGPSAFELLDSDSDYNSVMLDSDHELLRVLDQYVRALKAFPLAPPGRGSISSGFGFRVSPFTHTTKIHEGIDLSLPHGSKVYVTGDGVVEAVERHPTYGLVVDIRHNKRVLSRYAHLSRAFLAPGAVVTRGQILGLVGSSGRSTGPHLHYEIRVDGVAKNPQRYLALADRLDAVL